MNTLPGSSHRRALRLLAFLLLPTAAVPAVADDLSYDDYRALEMAMLVADDAEFVRSIAALCPDVTLPALPDIARIDATFIAALGVGFERYLELVSPLVDFRLSNTVRATALATNLECRQVPLDPFLWDVEFGLPDHLERLATGPKLGRSLEQLFADVNVEEIIAGRQREMQRRLESIADAIVSNAPSIAVVRFVTMSDVPMQDRRAEWNDVPEDFVTVEVRHGWKSELPHYVPVGGPIESRHDELHLVAVRPTQQGYLFEPLHPDLVPLVIERLGPVQWRLVEEEVKEEALPVEQREPRRFEPGVVG